VAEPTASAHPVASIHHDTLLIITFVTIDNGGEIVGVSTHSTFPGHRMRIKVPVRDPPCVTDPTSYRHLGVQLFIDSHYNGEGDLVRRKYEVYIQRRGHRRQVIQPRDIPGLGHWQPLWKGISGVLTQVQVTHFKLDLYTADREERPLPAATLL
jgi:hypothetical protein